MKLNDPEVVRAIADLHDVYEQALASNDVQVLDGFFWDAPEVVRFGVAEQLYGSDALRAYRKAHTPPFTSRRVVRRVISSFGDALATVMCETELVISGEARQSRQSQTWVQFPGLGWKIVAAHVSNPIGRVAEAAHPGLEASAAAAGLQLSAERRAAVALQLERISAIAAPLIQHELEDAVELPAVFHP